MGDDRPSVYKEADRWVFRISSLGFCVTHLSAVALGVEGDPVPDNVIRAWANGHIIEELIKFRLREQLGLEVGREQEVVEIPIGSRAMLRGHWDGVISCPSPENLAELIVKYPALTGWDGSSAVLEAKSIYPGGYEKWIVHRLDAYPTYRLQTALYSHYCGLPIVFAVQSKGGIMDFDLSYYPRPSPTTGIVLAAKKVQEVLALVAGGEVPMCGGKSEFGSCQYQRFHNEKHEEKKTSVYFDDLVLETQMQEYRELGIDEKEIKEKRQRVKAQIELHALKNGGDGLKIVCGAHSSQWIESDYLDQAAMKIDYPELVRGYRMKSKWLRVDGPRIKRG